MPIYSFSDESYSEDFECENLAKARKHAIDSWQRGSWDTKGVVEVNIHDEDGDLIEVVEVPVGEDPDPPACLDGETHDWCSPLEVLGGCDSNPGVWSTGGTSFEIREVCQYCGVYKIQNIVGAQHNPGECDTIRYEDPDETSLRWIQ